MALSLGGVRREVEARHLDPMRPTPGRPPLVGEAWLYELKLDGFRLLADVRRRDVVLRYRSGHVCTDAFPELVESLGAIGLSRVVLDGEEHWLTGDLLPGKLTIAEQIERSGAPTSGASRRVRRRIFVCFIRTGSGR